MSVLLFILAIGVMLVGLLGTIVPILPGIPVIAAAAVGYALLSDRLAVDSTAVITLLFLTGVSLLVDWLATALGTKRYGGNWLTMTGAVIGMIIGALVLQIVGIFLGAFVGAFLVQLGQGRSSREARRAGLGAVLGVITGSLMRIIIGVVMIGIFAWSVLAG